MPEVATVWMVHKDVGRAGVRGDLTMVQGRLIFRPEVRGAKLDTLGETVIPLTEVSKVRRARATPVLEVHVSTEGLPDVVLFYFVKPPDPYSSGMPNPRSADLTYLATSNTLYEEEVAGWVKAIKTAARSVGGA
jgi:hypothetical protein